jgi:hypothetical protein
LIPATASADHGNPWSLVWTFESNGAADCGPNGDAGKRRSLAEKMTTIEPYRHSEFPDLSVKAEAIRLITTADCIPFNKPHRAGLD